MTGRHPEPETSGENHNPAGLGLVALIREDLATHGGDLLRPGFRVCALHRLGNARMDLPRAVRKPVSLVFNEIYRRTVLRLGIEVPYTVRLGRRVEFAHHGGTVVNGWAAIGDDCVIRHGVTIGVRDVDRVDELPVLRDRVDVGAGAVILGGIDVGEGSRIGANAVVVRDVAPGSIVGGVPAKNLSRPVLEDELA